MYRFITKPSPYVVLSIFLISLYVLFFYTPASIAKQESIFGSSLFKAEIKEVLSEGKTEFKSGVFTRDQELLVTVFRPDGNEEIQLKNNYVPFKIGDIIYLQHDHFDSKYSLSNFDRTNWIYLLFAMFVLVVVAVSGIQGLNSIIGLIFTFTVVVKFLIPSILNNGSSFVPILISSLVILVVNLYVSHGTNLKTISAFIGIAISFLVVIALAFYFTHFMRLTGFTEESFYLNYISNGRINFLSLLIAGILIASIGILDDVAVTQASTVFGISRSAENLDFMEIFRKSMSIGKDHIAAIVNTLVLAYAGSGLPAMLILVYDRYPLSFAVSGEGIAIEIIRTLVASIGLVLAVPLTTLAAVFIFKFSKTGNMSKML